jgi:integrase
MPLRAVYRRAVRRGLIGANPTIDLELPAPARCSRRIASPADAAALLAALPKQDRPVWATAFYGGLRLGELLALRVEDVDFGASVIRVGRSWDPKSKVFTDPKSDSGWRTVPLTPILRDFLDEHKLSSGRSSGLLFGPDGERPAVPSTLWRRGRRAAEIAGVSPISLHEARHTFASMLIAAGVNAKAISTYMGHSSIQITFDLYGHLMPGNEAEAGKLLHEYLQRSMLTPTV